MNALPQRYNVVIGATGPIASGKGVIADAVREEFAGRHVQSVLLSDYIRDVLRAEGRELTRDTLREAGNARRKQHGPGAWVQEMLSRLPEGGSDILLVDSIRNPGEIRALREAFGQAVFVIATDAPLEERIRRTLSRAREEDGTDAEHIRRDMMIEMEENPEFGFSLRECRELADVVSIAKESKAERIREVKEWVREFAHEREMAEMHREGHGLRERYGMAAK